LHLVGILFPHINDDARSKSHQIRKNKCLHLSTLQYCIVREAESLLGIVESR